MAHESPQSDSVEMPKATVWPLVLSVGATLLAAGWITHPVLLIVGGVLTLTGLAGWIGQMLPGVGHQHEELVPADQRPHPITPRPGSVEALRPDRPGYRFRMPEKIHPISAGVKGGIAGGLVMPIPALAYGLLSGHGVWFPINLLGGMVFPFVEGSSIEELEKFNLVVFLAALFIHAIISTGVGSMYGVILPTVPQFAGSQLFFGGLVLPLLWSGICFGLMGSINPTLEQHVDWRYFIASQIVFGIAASIVVERSEKVYITPAGGEA